MIITFMYWISPYFNLPEPPVHGTSLYRVTLLAWYLVAAEAGSYILQVGSAHSTGMFLVRVMFSQVSVILSMGVGVGVGITCIMGYVTW